ncbi:hypothetical protein VOLCADRAFT_118721 [Volvox carteri f. nagariensis]|uniref:SET domain-containing protein n=1 Tax=Volvox carteri f. nagariensis TaxID=3068 RepID=D8U6W9_VOLCA|nr:uncharacterized protein VOLCADRAFT_118721 [Volvox carteri f. nagariensis]EFJ44585.1 hypothetical protein VOLCADRAFT_118721 [Volvox carteri f. nagariensis]|eukprot:XP_002954435.1 hypothetical protein VOLCADRAFT_118721 [Volvox carteri f. nagariensis]
MLGGWGWGAWGIPNIIFSSAFTISAFTISAFTISAFTIKTTTFGAPRGVPYRSGRGIVATSDLEPGQLVLISRPLAYVTCPMGAIPSAEDLAAVTDEGPNSGSAAAATAAGCGEVEVIGHLGLFPSFSFLNHSCLPNAVNFVVGGIMVVVAARKIRQGSEVLINYLGRASLRPVGERQGQLAEGYHFSCDCPRCRTELLYGCTDASRTAAAAAGSGGDGTAAALGALLSSVQEDLTNWEELVRRADLPAAAAAAAAAAGEEEHRQWLRASAFDLYGQYVALAEATGRRWEALTVVRQQVAICDAVAPASDLHMYLEVKRALLAQSQQGKTAAEAAVSVAAEGMAMGQAAAEEQDNGTGTECDGGEENGWQRCIELLRRRYGNGLSDATLAMLLRGAVYGLSQVAL